MFGQVEDSKVKLCKNGGILEYSYTILKVIKKSIDKLRLLSDLSIHIKLFEICHDFNLLLWYYIQKLYVKEGIKVGFKVKFEIVFTKFADKGFW